jgi:hypothetical protein
MITTATIAITIERLRARCLPGREAVECAGPLERDDAASRRQEALSHRAQRRA